VGLAASDTTSEYLYKGDPDASAVIEHTAKTDFEKSSKPRLVEFYSPVSDCCAAIVPSRVYLCVPVFNEAMCNHLRSSEILADLSRLSLFYSFAGTLLSACYHLPRAAGA
jgi:hypothetical protein